jgi:DNA-binding MarR family transcriptional regulator
MSRTVDNLVNKKYVLRKTSENDRRITNIKLSEQGKEAFNGIETTMNEKFKKVYEDIDIEERKNILNSLSKLIDVFNKNK